jgi:hypothetical protein
MKITFYEPRGSIAGSSSRGQILQLRPPLSFARSDTDKTIAATGTAQTWCSI